MLCLFVIKPLIQAIGFRLFQFSVFVANISIKAGTLGTIKTGFLGTGVLAGLGYVVISLAVIALISGVVYFGYQKLKQHKETLEIIESSAPSPAAAPSPTAAPSPAAAPSLATAKILKLKNLAMKVANG